MISPTGYFIRQKLSFIIISLLEISIGSLFIAHVSILACNNGPMCSFQAYRNECYFHPESMLIDCPLFCLNPCLCDVSQHTNDTACDCLLKAQTGYCNLNVSHTDCPTTCAIVNLVNCGHPPAVRDPNAFLSLSSNSTNFMTYVVELCNKGYRPERERDQGKKICMKDGVWHEEFFNGRSVVCTLVDCKEPPLTQNATVSFTSTNEGSQANYTCNKGYIGRNNVSQTTLTCMNDDTWSRNRLDCETHVSTFACNNGPQCSYQASKNECYMYPESMLNDCPLACLNPCLCDVSQHTNDTACDCLLKAQTGYCNLNVSHTDCPTTCAIVNLVNCGHPPAVRDPNAFLSLSSNSTNFMTYVVELCNKGYRPERERDQGKKICMKDGVWHEEFFNGRSVVCTLVDCKELPLTQNATVSFTSTNEGSQANYTCNKGYIGRNVSQTTLTCMNDDTWSGNRLDCEKMDCGLPPTPVGANVTYISTYYGDKASYECYVDYKYQSGDLVLTCAESGTWQGVVITCETVVCGDAPIYPGAHRWVSQVQGQYKYKDQAHYQCFFPEPGKEGQQWILECGAQKRWIGAEPQCEGTSTTKAVDTSSTRNDDKYTWFLGAGILGMVVFLGAFFMIIGLSVHSKHLFSNVNSLRKSLFNSKNTKIKPIDAADVNLP